MHVSVVVPAQTVTPIQINNNSLTLQEDGAVVRAGHLVRRFRFRRIGSVGVLGDALVVLAASPGRGDGLCRRLSGTLTHFCVVFVLAPARGFRNELLPRLLRKLGGLLRLLLGGRGGTGFGRSPSASLIRVSHGLAITMIQLAVCVCGEAMSCCFFRLNLHAKP